jgi:tRNA-dihydrouridine synthase A
MLDHRLCVAPMMDRTDRHDRFFLRRMTRHTVLYSEMVTTGALIHGDAERFLRFDQSEHPVALQLGGSDPADLARCATMAVAWGYDEVNLNVGCPSDRVQRGRIGACLMAEPRLVADCVAAMRAASDTPVTVKTRIGIDDHDDYAFLRGFVETVAGAGCRTFIVHARKAYLSGLSPKDNRDVPPLDYDRVYRLKGDFLDLEIIINGGIATLDEARSHLTHVDGVMIGRAAYEDPFMLAEADRTIFGETGAPAARHAVVEQMVPYVDREVAAGVPLHGIARHMLGLFRGQPGGRAWRRHISEHAPRSVSGSDVLRAAVAKVRPEAK